MKTPVLLLGAALLFWGWRTGHVIEGSIMAVVLEGSRLIKARWDFTDEDFRRMWTFCALLLLATALYAFTANGAPGDIKGLLQNPNLAAQRAIGTTSARTISALMRWLPMIFFLFVAAQAYSSRQGIAPETISVIMRLRWQKARKSGTPMPTLTSVDVTYPYFVLCLLAASFRSSEDNGFYLGLCALVPWALWPHRSRRYGIALWLGTLAVAVLLGYSGQRAFYRMYRLFEAYNVRWFLRVGGRNTDPAQSKTALGEIGRLSASGKIVIRLEPKAGSPAPSLLREASYQTWKGQAWTSDARRDRFDNVFSETNTTWVLLPGKAGSAAVSIACYLPGGVALLPLPPGSSRLENLSAHLVQKSELGAVLAEGPGLVVFDALYDPARPVVESSANTNQDLHVPLRETAALDQVISHLRLPPQPDRKTALKSLSSFFADNFRYSSWQGFDRLRSTNETPLGRFLTRKRSGHCEYFATATVLLLRRLGIPARYVVGYAVHEASGNSYVVRQRDAHAWCLVWNASSETWQDFDTTPALWVAREASRASPMQLLSDWWSRAMFEVSKFRWGQTRLRQYLLWGVVPVLGLLLYRIVVQIRRQHAAKARALNVPALLWPGLDSEFYQIERRLAQHASARPAGEPLSAWLQRAAEPPEVAPVEDSLRRLLHLHYRYRFDPNGLTGDERETLRREASSCLARLGLDHR